MLLSIYSFSVTNPCDGTSCTFMCLLSSTDPNGYSCACPDGYELASDSSGCTCELKIYHSIILTIICFLLIVVYQVVGTLPPPSVSALRYSFDCLQLLVPYLHLLLLVHVLTLGIRTVVLLATVLEVLQLVAVT